MYSSLAIEAKNLSKKYRLGTIGMSSLRDDLSRWWNRNNKDDASDAKKVSAHGHSDCRLINSSEFWALHDLNFSINKGEVVGLVGANGSGKSTLLKILSRITEPSKGQVKVRGKVASLLEVGTGFHPELTGRENVYINGAILGMTRREVTTKFDEIIDFAGVSDFIDTPIKRYSSGMTVRLGFAVAAHLDPDILIVDEVLAVGDLRFQNRCIQQMRKIAHSGKTVLFVSHQMQTVESLCQSTLLLDQGKILNYGKTHKIISEYRELASHSNLLSLENLPREGNGHCKFIGFKIQDEQNKTTTSLISGKKSTIKLTFKRYKTQSQPMSLSLGISTDNQVRLAHLCMKTFGLTIPSEESDLFHINLNLEKVELNEGKYLVTIFLDDESGEIIDWVTDAFEINVVQSDFYGTGLLPSSDKGPLLMKHSFN
jgi:lipopolysaccharide transport system ATP-binding protein